MGVDESGTPAAPKAHRHELIDPKFAAYDGRTVKTTGDACCGNSQVAQLELSAQMARTAITELIKVALGRPSSMAGGAAPA